MPYHHLVSITLAFIAPVQSTCAWAAFRYRSFGLHRHLGAGVLLLVLAACAPANLEPPETKAVSPETVTVVPEEVADPRFVNWDSKGHSQIVPPQEVLQEIISRCQSMGFEIGFVSSIMLEESGVKAAYNCRGSR